MIRRLLLILFLLAAPVWATQAPHFFDIDFGDLVTPCEPGRLFGIKDAPDSFNCGAGGGTAAAVCQCDEDGLGYTAAMLTSTYDNDPLDGRVDVAIEAAQVFTFVRKDSGGTIAKGTPVYIEGFNVGQNVVTVEEADADDPDKMPVLGLASEELTNSVEGHVQLAGTMIGVDTSGGGEAWSVGDHLYISTTQGALTNIPPLDTAPVQMVAVVSRAHASSGVLVIHDPAIFTDIDTDYGDETVTSDWTFRGAGSTGAHGAYDLVLGDTYAGFGFGNVGIYSSSFAASNLDLDKAVLFRQEGNIGAGNDPGIEFAWMEQGNTVRFAIPESGAGNAMAFVRSGTFAGPYSSGVGNDIVLCDQWTAYDTNIDCNTSGTGADLFVQDDLEVEGTIFLHETLNFEGATPDGNQVILQVGADPGSDIDITLPTSSGILGWPAGGTGAIQFNESVSAPAHATAGGFNWVAATPRLDLPAQMNITTFTNDLIPLQMTAPAGTSGDTPIWQAIHSGSGVPTALETDGDLYTKGKLGIAPSGSPIAANAACIFNDSDRLFHDTNCDGTKDVGEEYIDQTGGGGSGVVHGYYETVTNEAYTTTPEAVDWDSEQLDPNNWHDDVTNPSRVTVDADGVYLLNTTCAGSVNVENDSMGCTFYVNGAAIKSSAAVGEASHSGSLSVSNNTAIRFLSDGNYIEVFISGYGSPTQVATLVSLSVTLLATGGGGGGFTDLDTDYGDETITSDFNFNGGTLGLPSVADCSGVTTDGDICWDNDGDYPRVGTGTVARILGTFQSVSLSGNRWLYTTTNDLIAEVPNMFWDPVTGNFQLLDSGVIKLFEGRGYFEHGIALGSGTLSTAVCLAEDGADRVYHDANCNGARDVGEEYVETKTTTLLSYSARELSNANYVVASLGLPAAANDVGTNVTLRYAAFDPDTDECGGTVGGFQVPEDVGPATASVRFSVAYYYAVTEASGTCVQWYYRELDRADNDPWDAAYSIGSNSGCTDLTNEDEIRTQGWGSTLGALGWTEGEWVDVFLCRNADNGGDTLDQDALVLSFDIELTVVNDP